MLEQNLVSRHGQKEKEDMNMTVKAMVGVGQPKCSNCGCTEFHSYEDRMMHAKKWLCNGCGKEMHLTSGHLRNPFSNM